MADSNITKKALAAAMKELMLEKSFSKISVSDICGKCSMNRKSFYYHFQDKYDLVNWIFDVEFISIARKNSYENAGDAFYDLLRYFYENRVFYKKALSVTGQNSLREHFRELLLPFFGERLDEELSGEDMSPETREFYINFLSDAFICAILRWLLGKECMPADEFFEMIRLLVVKIGTIHSAEELKN